MAKRANIPTDVIQIVLHEASYRCASPRCRMILTLEIHHIVHVSDGGGNRTENLLPLCTECHTLHHKGAIPQSTIRAWKFLMMAVNEAFSRRSVDLLLAVALLQDTIICTGDGLSDFAPLIVSGLISTQTSKFFTTGVNYGTVEITLSERGRAFVEAWKNGDQVLAIRGLPVVGEGV